MVFLRHWKIHHNLHAPFEFSCGFKSSRVFLFFFFVFFTNSCVFKPQISDFFLPFINCTLLSTSPYFSSAFTLSKYSPYITHQQYIK
ncbi:hypothetical protein BC829DRAFT_388443 [Chytridium lagenaria]|nr:hypothetical protein BC829DRAFT_388443 [Chytridium lagenaria]